MCQRFVERDRKRHAAAEEAVKKAQSKFEAELQEGLDRLKRLREEGSSITHSMRVDPPDEVSTLRLRNHISELEEEAQSRNAWRSARGRVTGHSPRFGRKRKSKSCGSQCGICRESGIF